MIMMILLVWDRGGCCFLMACFSPTTPERLFVVCLSWVLSGKLAESLELS